MFFDVIVIGAGASGMACAMALQQCKKTVAIIDHNDKPMRKIAISGGGNCNFTNKKVSVKNYVSNNGSFASFALSNFSEKDFINLVKKHKIQFIEKNDGQLFCSESSQAIIKMLKEETDKASLFLDTQILEVDKKDVFTIKTNKGMFESTDLVVASGGISYPQIKASDVGYKIAKNFGLKIVPCKPALVPFNLDNEIMKDTIKLKGTSIKTSVKCNNFQIIDNILFTHFGLSGPAILQMSLYWNKGDKVTINLLPDINIENRLIEIRNKSKGKKISNILNMYLPNKIASFVIGDDDIFITEASNKLIKNIAKKINSWEIVPIGTQGFKLAEVTKGGVDTNEINPKTFEAKKEKGLFFIGEVLDVTGQLGGYNLQWAWSSGIMAGKYIKEK